MVNDLFLTDVSHLTSLSHSNNSVVYFMGYVFLLLLFFVCYSSLYI